MNQQEWVKIKTVVTGALEIPPPERQSYIREACDGDRQLLHKVQEQLRSITKSKEEGFLEKLGADQREFVQDLSRQWSQSANSTDLIGQKIEPYKIIKQLGTGGMGTVFKAERVDGAFKHTVAIKLIRNDIESEEIIRRFKREREILASLNHPNIAQLFDGGITPDGLPYLIMEHVDGVPVTEYCKKRKLSLNNRLDLFSDVCEAIMYAHRNLVVHRDLKPSNILVTEDGGVKLLDFGIAKLLEDSYPQGSKNEGHQANSLPTAPPTQLMTPWYASPEQISGRRITTAADIYTLGVILYELITGTLPFDYRGKSPSQIEQIIESREPQKPSEAASRESKSFFIQKDLDLICLKALRKEPDRRYGSVQELKEDLLRYRQGLPIHARPATMRYRFSRFITRNKAQLGVISLFLVAAVIFGSYHVYQITEQRNIAQLEAEKATQVKNFTTKLFDANNPYYRENTGEAITLEQLLEAGIRNVETELDRQPEIYAEMHTVFGHALLGLGQYDEAKASLMKSLDKSNELYGENHPAIAENLSLLGRLEGREGHFDAAMSWLTKALAMNQILQGETSTEVAVNYAEIGRIHARQRDYKKAADYYKKALNIHEMLEEEKEPDYNLTLSELVNVQSRLGQLDEAEKNQLKALENLKNIYGDNHLSVADSYISLAEIQYWNSDFEQSEKYIRQTLKVQNQLLGPDHPGMINSYSFLGSLLQRRGKYRESEKSHQEAIRLFLINELTDSLSYSSSLNNLALTKASLGQLDSAAALHQEALKIRNRLLDPGHPSITLSMYNLGDVYYKMEDFKQARALFEQVVERDKNALGGEHREVAVDLVKLAAVTRDLMEYDKAEQYFKEAEKIFGEKFSPDHYRTGEFYMEYGRLKIMKKEDKSAIDLLEKSLANFQQNYGETHKKVLAVKKYLASISN